MKWINGRTIIVAGASSGIGRELTIKLIKEYNCNVIGIGRSKPKMDSLKIELSYFSDRFTYQIFDGSIENNWVVFRDYLEKNLIHPDIFINCIGFMPPFYYYNNYSDGDIEKVFKNNYYPYVYGVRYIKALLSKSMMPAIINITDIDCICPWPGTSVYAASKAAVKSYTECLIAELGREMHIGSIVLGRAKTDIYRHQKSKMDSRYIKIIQTRPEKLAKKIIIAIEKRKNIKVIGKDAKITAVCYKICPSLTIKFNEIIIRKSRAKIFSNIFPYNR